MRSFTVAFLLLTSILYAQDPRAIIDRYLDTVSNGDIQNWNTNSETFLLEYWNGRKDEDLSMLAKFFDYKMVDEFVMPMSTSAMKDGNIYFSSRTLRFVINRDGDPEIFKYRGEK